MSCRVAQGCSQQLDVSAKQLSPQLKLDFLDMCMSWLGVAREARIEHCSVWEAAAALDGCPECFASAPPTPPCSRSPTSDKLKRNHVQTPGCSLTFELGGTGHVEACSGTYSYSRALHTRVHVYQMCIEKDTVMIQRRELCGRVG